MVKKAKLKRDDFLNVLADNLMSRAEFAKKAGVSYHYISSLISKQGILATPPYAKKILIAFDNKHSFDDLFYWVDEPQ